MTLDLRSREPIYTQIEKQIVKLINAGVYEKDEALPSVRNVACDLGINPNTVAKAYKNLEKNGVVYTVSGKGVFVNSTNLKEVHKIATKKLETSLIDAKNSGVDKKDIIELVNNIWGDKND